jgi:hypothetical protein
MSLIQYNLSQQIPGFNSLIYDTEANQQPKLKKSTSNTNNVEYHVIKYEKPVSTYDLASTFGLCRSVVVNLAKQVVCFSPPKSIPFDVFSRVHQDGTLLLAQEFVEGTMINVFWDEAVNRWEISTRSTVGGASSFYKSKTFNDMFVEALIHCNLNMNQLDTNYCYSFVLQHPDNRIVIEIKTIQLYLVGVYSIDNTPNDVKVMSHRPQDTFDFSTNTVKLPEMYEWVGYDELIKKYASHNTPYNCQGFVVYNTQTGERTKVRNPNYESVRRLRGNQPKLQYQYLTLRKQGAVGDFLKFYPEYKNDLAKYREQVHAFTNILYNGYVSCYIKKERPLKEYPENYRTHMYLIHQQYITKLKDSGGKVTRRIVQDFVNEMHPSLLMHSLNMDKTA